jgi:hypothetical protein
MYSMMRKALATGLLAFAVSMLAPSTASADYIAYMYGGDNLYCDERVVAGGGDWSLTLFCGGTSTGFMLQEAGPGIDCTYQQTGYCWGGYGWPSDHAFMQGDGNFVAYQGGTARWSTGTNGWYGAFLSVQDDSNIVVYTSWAYPLWSIW